MTEPRDPDEVLYRGTLGAGAARRRRARRLSLVETFRSMATRPTCPRRFGATTGGSPFRNAGYMSHRRVWTLDLEPAWDGPRQTLGDILEPPTDVPDELLHPATTSCRAGSTSRAPSASSATTRDSGTPYFYVEGPIPYPDRTDWPARTILTGEGGRTPSRFKHLIQVEDGRYRRLTPRELERLERLPGRLDATRACPTAGAPS